MPTSDDFGARDRAHVRIDALRERAAYQVPGRKQSRKPMRDDYTAHADALLSQLAAIFAAMDPSATRLSIEGLKPGTIVEVATAAPAGRLAQSCR